MSGITLTEAQVHKVNAQPGETLIFKFDTDEMSHSQLSNLRTAFTKLFPNNKVAVLCCAGDLKISSVAQAQQ